MGKARSRQYPLRFPVRSGHRRQDLLVGPSNRLAVEGLFGAEAGAFTVHVIHGARASGKTHLLEAWAAEVGALLATVDGLRQGPLLEGTAFGVDDAEAVCGDRLCEENLFHLINRLRAEGGRLVLTGSAPPARWPFLLPDLASRVRAGALWALGSPDDALLEGLLKKHLAERGLVLQSAVSAYVLRRIERSALAVADIARRLDEAALAARRPLTVDLARTVLDDAGQGLTGGDPA